MGPPSSTAIYLLLACAVRLCAHNLLGIFFAVGAELDGGKRQSAGRATKKTHKNNTRPALSIFLSSDEVVSNDKY